MLPTRGTPSRLYRGWISKPDVSVVADFKGVHALLGGVGGAAKSPASLALSTLRGGVQAFGCSCGGGTKQSTNPAIEVMVATGATPKTNPRGKSAGSEIMVVPDVERSRRAPDFWHTMLVITTDVPHAAKIIASVIMSDTQTFSALYPLP